MIDQGGDASWLWAWVFQRSCRESADIAWRAGRVWTWRLLFSPQACGAGQKSVPRKSSLAPGEICKDGTLGLSVRLDCGGEIDRNYNWQVTDLNIYWLQLTTHTYSSATYIDFDLIHTLSQDVTNAWMLHTLSLLHKHTHADVTHNFSDVTHTHSDVTDIQS